MTMTMTISIYWNSGMKGRSEALYFTLHDVYSTSFDVDR
jgi:hypothetical protein